MMKTLRENLEAHLKQIVRERNPYLSSVGHFYVREYIREEFGKFAEVEVHTFQIRGKVHENLLINLAAQNNNLKNQPPILVAAHYDSVPGSAGADDNASGVAVLLELARFFGENPAQFPLRLVAFDMEEYGLLGSRAYAKLLKRQKQKLRLMIGLEMLGYCSYQPNSQKYPPGLKYLYPSQGNFIALIGNLRCIPDLLNMTQQMRRVQTPCQWLAVPFNGLIIPDTRRSDHASFWDQGYSALMVTDTSNFRNPHYHKSSDTLETLDLDFLTSVCYGLAQSIQFL